MGLQFRFPLSALASALALGAWALGGCHAPASPPGSGANAANNGALTQTSRALFEDVATQSGLDFTHVLGDTGKFYFPESTPPGCAFLDFDNDGDQDIFLVQSGSAAPPATVKNRPFCALYRNNGDGTFANVTAGSGLDTDFGYGQGVSVADYDNDGFDDLFVTAFGVNHLFHNQGGSGKWRETTRQMNLAKVHDTGYATSSAWGDYDGDGKLDLYVCYYSHWNYALNKPCIEPATDVLDYCPPLEYGAVTHRLYHNEGARFVDVSEKAGITKKQGRGLAVAWLDFNDDGKPDIFVANDQSALMLWRNNGDGTFTDVAAQTGSAYDGQGQILAGMGVAVADYNHTGEPSLYVSNFSSLSNILFKNEGGTFSDATQRAGLGFLHLKFLTFGCEFLDYDADSWPDIITNNGHVQMTKAKREAGVDLKMRKQLLHNQGDGSFKEITDPALLGDLATPVIGRGLAVGDYDNDGRIDVLAMAQNAPVQLLHNRADNGNHWVSFNTIGTKSNRDGIGAKLEIEAGGVKQTAAVRAGSSYLSSSDKRVYFGLKQAAKVDRLTLTWPSGARETLNGLDADTFYTLTEGKGVSQKRAPRSAK